jgi:hypothetical protein
MSTCTITPLTQNPVLEVVKTATVTSNGTTTDVYSFVDIINYTIEVKFRKCDLQIVVTDPLRLNTTIERLAPGGPTPLLVKVTRLQKRLSKNNSVTNTANANGKLLDRLQLMHLTQ